jgi:hypothetical protein
MPELATSAMFGIDDLVRAVPLKLELVVTYL